MTKKKVSLWDIFFTFLLISPITFGGGFAMVAMLERVVTEKKKWLHKEELVDGLSISQSIPGSIAVNCATFIGYQLAGLRGALIATVGVTLPTFFIVILLAVLFLQFQDHPLVQAAFLGIRPAIVALILFAAFGIGKAAIIDRTTIIMAVLALIMLLFLHIHPLYVLLLGAFFGILWKNQQAIFKAKKDRQTNKDI